MHSIASSYLHTLAELSIPQPTQEELRQAIGPGLHRAMETLLNSNDKELIENAVSIYRRFHDSVGYKATKFYAGIRGMLEELSAQEVPQFVASMKADTIVKPILTYLDSLHYFVDAIGSSPTGQTKTKAEMLTFLSEKYNFLLSDAILVGDTAHDARAAKEAGVVFYAVTFGYGTQEEMAQFGWNKIYHNVADLRAGLIQVKSD